MSVRAKFKCTSVNGPTVRLEAVYGDGKENKEWAKYTPVGQLQMHIDNPPALAQFVQGKEYYLDINPVVTGDVDSDEASV